MASFREALTGVTDRLAKPGGARRLDPDNPLDVAQAQTESNIKTAEAQQRLGMTGQTTPWGTLSYSPDPSSPSGFRATTTLAPDQQALSDATTYLRHQSLGPVDAALREPLTLDRFDANAGRATELTDMQRTFLDPQWDQRGSALHAELLNRGLRPGSEQWATAMQQHEDARSRAYNAMFLDAYGAANNAALSEYNANTQAALTERGLPFSEMSTLFGMPQPGAPQWAPVPTPGVAPTDLTGTVNAAQARELAEENARRQQESAKTGGLFSLGSSALGGWAMSGFPGASAALGLISDRRLKTAIVKLADDVRGWGIYAFRYLWDAAGSPLRFGVMADEVSSVRPDAVRTGSDGFMRVNYGALA